MRKVDENRAENYIKKHRNKKRWLAFALAVSLFTGTVTLYMLNKPATAMTEDGARQVGLVLETADSQFEQGLIQQMNSTAAEAAENADKSNEGESKTWEDIIEKIPEEGKEEEKPSDSSAETASDESSKASSKDEETADSSAASSSQAAEDSKESSAGASSSESASAASSSEPATSSASSEEKSSEASSEASSVEDATTASSDASSEASSQEQKEEEKKAVAEDKNVILTANYVDKAGNKLAESDSFTLDESTKSVDLTKTYKGFEGYYFLRATINGTKVVSLATKTAKETLSEDSAAKESSADEASEVIEYTYYEATTSDGKVLELKDNTDITFEYVKANDKESFSYKNGEVTVTVKLSNASVLPEGVELKVVTLDKETEGYNYEAYIGALNNNADEIAKANGSTEVTKYDDDNTVLFDIAFILDDVEYEPKDGTASVSIIFNNNQITDGLGTNAPSDVAIVHLPVKEEVMQDVDATSDATDITSRDIDVEVVKNGNVDLGEGADVVSFKTDSFSVYGTVKTYSLTTWQGDQYYSAKDIVKMLGDTTYFGVVSHEYDGNNNHSEANIAVGKISNIQNFTIGNSTHVYTALDTYMLTVTKQVSGTPKAGQFHFALFTDKDGKNKIAGSDFSITTDYSGYGTTTFDAAPFMKSGSTNARVYVFELDKQGGKAVLSGDKVGTYTVTYGTDSFEGLNDTVSYFTDNYIENMNGYTGEFVLQKVDGAKVYYKTSDTSYSSVQYTGSGYKKEVYEGSFPVDIESMISSAEVTASKLAYANSTKDVLVVNIVGTQGGYVQKDLTDKYFKAILKDVSDNYAVNTGFTIGENTLLLINVDLTGVTEYTFDKITVNGKGTGDWSTVANQIVLNPVQRDAKNDYHPYTGKLYTNIASGALIAPKSNVTLYSSYSGTIIADKVDKKCEIHKISVRRFLDAQASVDIYNASSNSEIIKIEADKYVDGRLANNKETGKFKFTFGMYDPVEKYWKEIDTGITNDGSKISYDLYPEKLGMVYGDGSTDQNKSEHTYYFMLTENDLDASQYNKDTTGILIKIKYYKGGEEKPLYYRASYSEYWDNIWNKTTRYYDDAHRIKSDNKVSDPQMKNVAFYNVTAETVDIEVTKAWILNGRDKVDIPKNAKDVVLTLYQISGGKTTKVDAEYTIKRESKASVENTDFTWKYTWSKLPRYDKDGNLINYTVAETTQVDGFKTDAPESNPKVVVFTTEGQYKNSTTGSTYLGTATITNKGASLKLMVHKYLDNQTPTEQFDFVIREKIWDGSKFKWVNYDKSLEKKPITNNGSDIDYTIDPGVWRMSEGNTYIFRMEEVELKYDTHANDKGNSPNYRNYKRDNGVILIKIDYKNANDIEISYYRVEREIGKIIISDCTQAENYCTSQYEVKGDKVAFYNSTSDSITISVTKVWDELVGRAKYDKAVADSIFDVTFRLFRSADGTNWEMAEEYTIKAPRIWQDSEGADFKGDLNDYPEDWTYNSTEGGYVSKPITFNNLAKNYQYMVKEYYVDANGNYTELTPGGATVNGFKLESIHRYDDSAGNIDFMLHNTPYIEINKYWLFNGEEVSGEATKDYNPVYVKLYKNYREDKNYVQVGYDELVAGATDKSLVIDKSGEGNGAIIELNYAHGWFAEFALDRKQDNYDGQKHVYQYVYFIKECDENGNDLPQSPYITYGSVNINNVTRTTSDYNYDRGFKNKVKSGEMSWENAWASGNNYPVCRLNVTNNRGTNELPHSGGIGDIPFKAVGAAVILIGFLVGMFFCARKRTKGFEA